MRTPGTVEEMVEWSLIPESEIRYFAEELFDSADVPSNLREEYWRIFDAKLKSLKDGQ